MGCTFVVVPSMGIKPWHLDSTEHDHSYAVYPCSGILCKNPRGGNHGSKLFVHAAILCQASLGLQNCCLNLGKQASQPRLFVPHEFRMLLCYCMRSFGCVVICCNMTL